MRPRRTLTSRTWLERCRLANRPSAGARALSEGGGRHAAQPSQRGVVGPLRPRSARPPSVRGPTTGAGDRRACSSSRSAGRTRGRQRRHSVDRFLAAGVMRRQPVDGHRATCPKSSWRPISTPPRGGGDDRARPRSPGSHLDAGRSTRFSTPGRSGQPSAAGGGSGAGRRRSDPPRSPRTRAACLDLSVRDGCAGAAGTGHGR